MRFFSDTSWSDFQKVVEDLRAENAAMRQQNKELTLKLMALVDARAVAYAESFSTPQKPENYVGTGFDEVQQFDEFGLPMWVEVQE